MCSGLLAIRNSQRNWTEKKSCLLILRGDRRRKCLFVLLFPRTATLRRLFFFSTADVGDQYEEIPPPLAHLAHTMRPQSLIDLPLASISVFSSLVRPGKRLLCVCVCLCVYACVCVCICLCSYLHHHHYLLAHTSKCHNIFLANVFLLAPATDERVCRSHSHMQHIFFSVCVCVCVAAPLVPGVCVCVRVEALLELSAALAGPPISERSSKSGGEKRAWPRPGRRNSRLTR